MTKVVEKSKLYETMVRTERDALLAQENLLNAIKAFYKKKMSDEAFKMAKVILQQGGYIEIRTTEPLEDFIDEFNCEFDFDMFFKKRELITDYTNSETIEIVVYSYSFAPKNLEELLS